jgi:hypothetical protein
MAGDFTYLYGFVPGDAQAPRGILGIGGSTVKLLDLGSVKAVISAVPADVYDPERIDEQIQDLKWVSEQGVAHEAVVAWFVDNSEILPVSLFTMYSTADALMEAATPRAAELTAEIERLRNKREWDVKISFKESEVERHANTLSARIAEMDRELSVATPGKRYLLERKRAEVLKAETRRAAQTLADEAYAALHTHTVAARTLPIPRAGDSLPVILHAALLVHRRNEPALMEAFEREGRRLERVGVELRFSGPWAPYRFTGSDERTPEPE